ncbi:MAG: IS200/IS605 family transposase [Prevotellaceae bacterium]|jgi:REP element-mobilizing transposase RayT|nr:IS200/IS605 family transposase [Prevotellaceae bacterium]
MNSHRQILYHIVFCTHNRQNTIPVAHHEDLYKYIWGIIKERKGVLYRINGTENHIHILSDLHPTVALSDYIKEIKTATNHWMKQTGNYPDFTSWAEGSCALTYAYRDKDIIINYIKNQKKHHQIEKFEDEYCSLLREFGIDADERYIF